MEQYTLYANFCDYDEEFVGEGYGKYLYVCKGIYHIQSTHGGITYPALKYICSIDLTHRRFVKEAKHPRKIYNQNENSLCLHNKVNIIGTSIYHIQRETYAPIRDVLLANNYTDNNINEIINIITTYSDDKSIKVHEVIQF